MANDLRWALAVVMKAQPGHDPALYDSATRQAYERGFEQMRAIALSTVRMLANQPDEG